VPLTRLPATPINDTHDGRAEGGSILQRLIGHGQIGAWERDPERRMSRVDECAERVRLEPGITVTPEGRFYEVNGLATYGQIIGGILRVQSVMPPG